MDDNIPPIEFNKELERTLQEASFYASRLRNLEITSLHLAHCLMVNPDVEEILNKLGIRDNIRRDIQAKLEAAINHLQVDLQASMYDTLDISQDVAFLFNYMFVQGHKYGQTIITGADLLEAYCASTTATSVIFRTYDITETRVKDELAAAKWKYKRSNHDSGYDSLSPKINMSSNDEDDDLTDIKAQQILERFTVNLNEKARMGLLDKVIGRQKEIDRCIRTLSRRKKRNLIFVGDAGVGKTAIVEGLAKRIINKEVHTCLKDSTIFAFDMVGLIASTKYRGDLEKRVKMVLAALEQLPDSILFIDEIHTLIGAGAASGSLDISNMLKPALAGSSIRCIGATTDKEYREHFEHDKAMSRRFLKLEVLEPSIEESVEILEGIKHVYEGYHGVTYTRDAILAACSSSSKYLMDKRLPDKAIDLLDEVGATIKLNASRMDKIVNEEDIQFAVAEIAKIPPTVVTSTNQSFLSSLKSKLEDKILGQPEALERLVNTIILARSGLRDESKPISNILFAGPTGVGKTELCKQLALELGVKMLRFDMSEYQESHTVSRLLGSPAGYIGHEDGGLLTEAINKTPHCLVLLDEVEKAHPNIYNVLLGLMDYGKLTDGQGREIDCRHILLIMTTNQGANLLEKKSVGFLESNLPDDLSQELKNKFSPEFRNRLDAVVQFNRLTPEIMEGIVKKFIRELGDRFTKQNITLHVSENAVQWLCINGYDEALGARPLNRIITENVAQPASYLLVFNDLKGKNPIINVYEEEDKLKVELVCAEETMNV